MLFTPVEGHVIPEAVVERFRGVSPEEQLAHFRLHRHADRTYSITQSGDQFKPPAFRLPCGGKACDPSEHEILTQDGVIVGIRIDKKDIYCYENPVGCLSHHGGHRTSSDYWYYDEDHIWYTFYLAEDPA